ncbi:uncharacterized protein PGTG_16436 [Puccinia graminis f. sp. tritici CRL 75-36-700-3]|uniref:Uncharacterized protein n=1 Tax=Puccinia graminis f. sp. tritici (strain CRL 75-36-700-3 / race SCCL) TaxID=418459 RepID=E3L3X0_PUCGT|nr:uncharacterized protein PGTG_16436 [Puccinia graminis f. sp. tritici CRL 75-36-700-3]EFP91245.1 hypothetical protein PGTG_16436 [Puccinia graminis f. sp. tritici CRL 75-36-700-3]
MGCSSCDARKSGGLVESWRNPDQDGMTRCGEVGNRVKIVLNLKLEDDKVNVCYGYESMAQSEIVIKKMAQTSRGMDRSRRGDKIGKVALSNSRYCDGSTEETGEKNPRRATLVHGWCKALVLLLKPHNQAMGSSPTLTTIKSWLYRLWIGVFELSSVFSGLNFFP